MSAAPAATTTGLLPMRATYGSVDFAGRRASWLAPIVGLSLLAAAIAYVAGIGATRMLRPKLASFAGLTEVEPHSASSSLLSQGARSDSPR